LYDRPETEEELLNKGVLMRAKLFMVSSLILVGLSGCAHGIMRGSVAMKTSDTEAHVCMGKGEVSAGDRVRLFENACGGEGAGVRSGVGTSCEKRELGMGTVEEVLNEHYSVVKFDKGVRFEKGTFVEKQ
jgi:N-methylhydantoinase B/oxoprolinase/acetone carboxylase alpha subunit